MGSVVVTTRLVGVGVGQWQNVHQSLTHWVQLVGWNNAVGVQRLAGRVQLLGAAAGSCNVLSTYQTFNLAQFGGTEVAATHASGWYGGANQAGIQCLEEVFKTNEEEQLVPFFVEFGAWDQNRATECAAWEEILVFRFRQTKTIVQPIIGVQSEVSCGKVSTSMVVLAARPAHRTDHSRALGIFR